MKIRLSQKITGILLVALLSVILFAGTATFRHNRYGEMRTLHAWFSDLTLQFARNWYRDGVIALRGALFWKPASPEFPDLPSRRMHSSYPSGMLLPVYLAAVVTRKDPTPHHVSFVNACCQLALMTGCAMMLYFFAIQAGGSVIDACIFSFPPLILLSLLPAPFYFFDKCYFSYEAVIPLVTLYLLLEMLRDTPLSKRSLFCLRMLQGVTAFLGAFTEWLFILIAAGVYIKRFLSGELGWQVRPLIRKTALFWAPAGTALSLFIVQVLCLGGYEYFQNRFLLRTGISQGKFLFLTTLNPFWQRHMLRMFGGIGIAALAVSAIALLLLGAVIFIHWLQKRPRDKCVRTAVWIGLTALVPCVAHVELLRNQSSFPLHGFEALKFSIPIALLPLGIVPLALLRAANLNWSAWTLRRGLFPSAVPVIAVVLAAGYAVQMYPRIASFYVSPISDKKIIERSVFLDKQTGPKDIIFTFTTEMAQDESPFFMAYTMKVIHLAQNLTEIHDIVHDIKGDYTLCFFHPTAQLPDEVQYINLLQRADTTVVHESYSLHRISKETFFAAWNATNP